ncbi:unnamed protein product [Rhizoctonia solani]|uniref:Inhibitor I9 domain-containing protein n=1 Tax=Rhizoctonia solani TaxID=456999 RepID=A0A8H3DQZ3_9AGAM|nr:unnamed protein product [Rhizoctonia solani]CAE7125998.1 unnamed protein product [Rhizoctonia solani]
MQASGRVPISRAGDSAIPGTYIVTLKPDCNLKSHLDSMKQTHQDATPSQFQVIHEFDILKGYQAKLGGPVLDHLTQRNDVKAIVEERRGTLDGIDALDGGY